VVQVQGEFGERAARHAGGHEQRQLREQAGPVCGGAGARQERECARGDGPSDRGGGEASRLLRVLSHHQRLLRGARGRVPPGNLT